MPETVPAYRQSALKAASCLKRFHEVYDLGLEDDSDESRRGTAFHRIALEEYVPALVRLRRPYDAGELDRAFHRGIVATRCPPHLVDEVESLVFGWGERFELDLDAFLEAEERQVTRGVSWKSDLTYAWRRTPRGSVLQVRDLKTYFAILSEDAIRSEFQAQVYTRNAMELYPGFDVYEFAMEFVRFGVTRVVEFAPEDLESLDRKVLAIVETIEDARARNDWPAQPGDHCGFCRLKCDVVDDDRMLERRFLTREETEAACDRLVLTGRMYDADLKALQAWCTMNGPVRRGGLEWAHRTTQRFRYAARAALDAIAKRRAPDPPGLSFSKSALSKLFTKKAQRAWPGLVEDLAQLEVPRTSTRFGSKKVGDQAPDADADAEE